MKKRFVKVGAALVAATLAASMPILAFAGTEEYSYTYNYDYWGDVQDTPDLYSVSRVFTSSDLKLDVNMKNPSGLYSYEDKLYILDSGNNRIIETQFVNAQELEVVRIIDSFSGAEPSTFNNPTDMAIAENGDIFVSDYGNARIVKLDKDLNFLLQFDQPVDNTLDPNATFQPNKLVIDSAERVYAIATGINKGLIKYEPDATFSGFIGATPVSFDFLDYLWKKFATQEQRARLESFVPTEYDNIYIDNDGFIYAVTSAITEDDLRDDKGDPVRRINLMGNDILIRNGEYTIIGDLYFGAGGGYSGPSLFSDITVLDNEIYVCLDRNRGRAFGYDDQGKLVFAFGGNGNMDGYFRRPVGIEHIGNELFILDNLDCAVTMFVPTEFGQRVFDAIELFDDGKYTESGEAWEEVKELDGNYDLAYIGIGRSLLRQKRYREAMDYFELKYDEENYSKAYKQYRKEWVEENIVIIVIVILAVFLIPLGIGKVRSIKREIDTADIFKE